MNIEEKLKRGFPLENPNIILEWNKPLDEITKISGGIWKGDRYVWPKVSFLNGLTYPITSGNGVVENDPFTRIVAYIGLNEDGLWDDSISLSGFEKVSEHLTNLFGKPDSKKEAGDQGEKSETWNIGNVHIDLNVINQFAMKCYLHISIKNI
jgi:hypothetical protein